MEELFSQNIFALYIIACLAVISYNNFKENQRIVLLYIFSYSICYFNILRVSIILRDYPKFCVNLLRGVE